MQQPSLEEIYNAYYKKIYSFVMRKISDIDITEDLVSDIFLKVAANLDRFDPEKACVSTWLYTIANNTVLDYYRTRKVYEPIPDENGSEGLMPEALVDTKDIESEIIANEELEELAKALEHISVRSRDVIVLHYYADMTLKDVAQQMGMSYANIKIVHKKALQELRDALQSA